MSAPLKPWERANYQSGEIGTMSNEMAASPFQDRIQAASSGTAIPAAMSAPSSAPPQLPPRPSEQNSSMQSRLGYGGMYNSTGYSGFGGMGYSSYSSPYSYSSGYGGYGGLYNSPYSSYGGYGGFNRFGGETNSSFARHAEESSRPAFDSINSIVQAVNSVGMMLDSTFQAVYNSFRAVIGVADNFSRLKQQLLQVFSALAFIRTLKYFLRKVLEILRLRPQGNADRMWAEAVSEAAFLASEPGPGGGPRRSSWPILMFFGIIMGGPYLIWKVISAFSGNSDENAWARGETDHYLATANFNFQAEGSEELSFSAGQTIKIAPKELQPRVRGWLLASVDGNNTGMIPANYIKVLGRRKGSRTTTAAAGDAITSPSSSEGVSGWNNNNNFNAGPSSSVAASLPTVAEGQLESAFPAASPVPSRDASFSDVASASWQPSGDVREREASDILNDASK